MRKVCLLLIILFGTFSSACGRKTEKELAQNLEAMQIADLRPDEIKVAAVKSEGQKERLIVADIRTAFLMKKNERGEWEIQSIRLGDRHWEDRKLLAAALNQLKAAHVRSDFEKLSTAIDKYREKKGTFPAVSSIEELTDLLYPAYLSELVRVDPWATEYGVRFSSATSFVLTSAGPDRKFGTADDLRFEK